jgi:homoserine dehydrogenase
MQINIGLIGFGTVGTGVVKILNRYARLIEEKCGVKLCLKKIADLDIITSRGVDIDPSLLTTNAEEIIYDNDIDVVVELIGGYEPARTYVLSAMRTGKHVVTANKALLSKFWQEVLQTAQEYNVSFYAEASVGGGIPLISSITQGLIANNIQSIYGIINGTCNYILTRMSEDGVEFSDALKQAQSNGYAEADPTLDIEGIDTAHKLSILSSISFGGSIPVDKISVEGISKITKQDICYADEFGYVIKLLGIAKRLSDTEIEVRVHPTMISKNHLLASVRDVFNAVYIIGDSTGPVMLYGQGAGQMPTASAVISDIIAIGCQNKGLQYKDGNMNIREIDKIKSKYYIRFTAVDRPGVLAKIANVLGNCNISIASCIQQARGELVPIIMLTHEAEEGLLKKAISEIDTFSVIKGKTVYIRVED